MTIFVGIGMQCTSAGALRDAQLKVKTYPFDWIFSSPQAITKVLWELKTYGASEVTKSNASCIL
jgi:hypothetical protein